MLMGRSLVEALAPTYLLYNCQAHALQLLVKDYLKGKDSIVNNVVSVLKSFRAVHSLSAALVTRNLTRPPLPCPTRWGSITRALSYWNCNWAPLVQVAAANLPPTDITRKVMENVQISRGVAEMLEVLLPITTACELMVCPIFIQYIYISLFCSREPAATLDVPQRFGWS